MQDTKYEQAVLDFYIYPRLGDDDWRYTCQTAQVRALETQMLTATALMDMANAPTFEEAAGVLAAGEYALPQTTANLDELETLLRDKRAVLRDLFAQLCIDEPIVKLFKSRVDFANLRLALRRTLTQTPVGIDYSDQGNVPSECFEQVFEQEQYHLLPDYMQQAAEQAVLAYYQNKDIRRIDHALDAAQAYYNLTQARRLKSPFLQGLFRIHIDLTNIRTMLRLKFTGSDQRNVLLPGGYVEPERFDKALEMGYESIAQLFFATPYYRIVEAGAAGLAADDSFLKLEQLCDRHLAGFLKTTVQITAGPQPIIAYLLMKENEIRTVRFILTAKKNGLDTKLILDRLAA